jgi:sensor histidine kinase YesM
MLDRRSVRWGLILFGWTVVGLIFGTQIRVSSWASGRVGTFHEDFTPQLIYTTTCAVFTPLVLWLARRFRIDQHTWHRHLPLHLLGATLFAVVVGAIYQFGIFLAFLLGERPFSLWNTLRIIVLNSSESFTIYGLMLLAIHLKDYYKRYRDGELRASQLQTQLAEAQLQALKMQLHPHFLFNTLHSISALLYKDRAAADKMIAQLGDFLRLTLDNAGTQEVSLREELEFLSCYLEIEQIRFNDRLTTHMHIDADALDTRVPNLILQPIVENAIRHGIAPHAAPGRIEILAERKNGTLRMQVRDNGRGLMLNQSINPRFREGLGLANTKARLEQLYGTAYRFELANDPDGGLVVTLEIPSYIEPAS